MSKRGDLQSLRGVAVLAVLVFHFYPSLLPNGFLGVDQFFVLSGYLMASIYGTKGISNFTDVAIFYFRRIKRIVPLYLFILLTVVVSIITVLPTSFSLVNMESAIHSMLFYSNMATKSDDNNYFLQLKTAVDLLAHTWSLCVEMQFYVFVPLVIWILLKLNDLFKLLALAVMASLSLFLNVSSEQNVAFNGLQCRVWQFAIGMATFFAEKLTNKQGREEEKSIITENSSEKRLKQKSRWLQLTYYLILVVIHVMYFNRSITDDKINRIVITIATAIFIWLGAIVTTKLFSNRLLVYVGDISYALYLVHWPIYCILNYFESENEIAPLAGMVISIFVAIVLHETFERFYMSLDYQGIFLIIAFLYALLSASLVSNELIEDMMATWYEFDDGQFESRFPANLSNEEVLRLQGFWTLERNFDPATCIWNHTIPRFCEFKNDEFETKCNYSTLIIGNSYATNSARLVNLHFAQFSKKLGKTTYMGCGVLTRTDLFDCKKRFDGFLSFTKTYQPDILFIIARMIPSYEAPIIDIDSDVPLERAWQQLQKYEEVVTKKIFILDSYFMVDLDYAKLFSTLIKSNKSVNEHWNEMIRDDGYKNSARRNAVLAKRCTKCVVYSYLDALTDEEGNPMIADPDTRLPLFLANTHLSPAGKERVNSVYARLADSLL